MNMTSIHSNTFSFQSQQLQYQNQNQKKIVDKNITPKEPAQIAESKSLEITAESLTIETDTSYDYDLENITPNETLSLAAKLYENEEISLQQFSCLACISSRMLDRDGIFASPNGIIATPPNHDPFNLKEELHKIASGSHDYNFTNPTMDTEASKLLDLLLSLPDKTTKIEYKSIDIKL